MRSIICSLKHGVNEHIYAMEDAMDVRDLASLVPDIKRKFGFELDDFQKRSVHRIEQGEHVMVIAHTSAGKTVTAESAIALARSHRMNMICTSPIKALGNQKDSNFSKIFLYVGIVTGLISIEWPHYSHATYATFQ